MAALLDGNNGADEVESFHDSRVDEMMIIEIVYGHGRKGKISVKFGDEPKALAEEFVKKYRLKPKSIGVVQHHIEATIEEFRQQNEEMRPQSPPHEDGMDDGILSHSRTPAGSMEPADFPPSPPSTFSGVSPIPMKEDGKLSKHDHRHKHHRHHHHSDDEKEQMVSPTTNL